MHNDSESRQNERYILQIRRKQECLELHTIRRPVLSSLIERLYSPNLDNACSIAANQSSPERRVDASEGRDRILVPLQKVLLVMVDEGQSLWRTIVLVRGLRGHPGLNER